MLVHIGLSGWSGSQKYCSPGEKTCVWGWLRFSDVLWKMYWLLFPADHTIFWDLKNTISFMSFSDYPCHSLYAKELSLVANPSRSHQQFEVKTSVVFNSYLQQGVQYRHTWTCAYNSPVYTFCMHLLYVHVLCVLSACFDTPDSWWLSRHHTSHVRLITWFIYVNISEVSFSSLIADSKLLCRRSPKPTVRLLAVLARQVK